MPATALEKAVAERRKEELSLATITKKVQGHSKIPLTIHQAEFFIEEADKAWGNIEEAHVKITTLDPDNLEDYESVWNKLFNDYSVAKCDLRGIKASLNPSPASSSHHAEVKLPKCQLPQFSGEVHDWISFRDMYITAIHNNTDLSEAQKFTYLKSSLTGKAAKLIKSLTISDANYRIAWDTVTNRFENKRELYFAIMQRFTTLPTASTSNASSLRSVVDGGMECTRALDTLNISDKWDSVLVYLMTQKLDPATREQWELSLKTTEIPAYQDLLDFIEQRARSLAASSSDSGTKKKDSLHRAVNLHTRPRTVPADGECSFCAGAHFNFRCPKFTAMKTDERRSLVQQKKLCFNCLRTNHRAQECQLGKSCKTCGRNHHSLLHPDETTNLGSNQSSNSTPNPPPSQVQTAILRVKTSQGGCLQFRALLDSGSTVSCISESCIGRLGLNREKVDSEVIGLGSTQIGRTRGLTQVHFKAHFDTAKEEKFCVHAYVLKKVTCRLPTRSYDIRGWHHLKQLQLADPNFNIPGEIDILLGADIFFKLILDGKRNGDPKLPDAVHSRLGWLVSGPVDSIQPGIQVHHATIGLEETLNRFWTIEQVPKRMAMTQEERRCEETFQETHYRDRTGRFVVQIPMKEPRVPLGYSRETAKGRLLQMEKKMNARPELKSLYQGFMDQYESLGHMTEAKQLHSSEQRIFIPHHYVLKNWDITSKFRVVFDASAKTSSGSSLNDAQMVGPVVQDSLYAIILRFRMNQFAFTADITKMYRQIWVAPHQRDLQCILWRPSPTSPIREYQLNTVTYGTASAPFLATRVLQQLGHMETATYPLGSKILKQDFYVDDVMSGRQTIDDTKKSISELRSLTDSAGLMLRKFSSNSSECLSEVPAELREVNDVPMVDEDALVKTLGLYWDTNRDQFLSWERQGS